MNDAHVHEMQVQKWKPNTWGVTILVCLTDREPLLLYITATTQVVSAALVVEQEEEGHALKVQRLVYFISEVLSKSKTCYP